jgi:hypothetical protein
MALKLPFQQSFSLVRFVSRIEVRTTCMDSKAAILRVNTRLRNGKHGKIGLFYHITLFQGDVRD